MISSFKKQLQPFVEAFIGDILRESVSNILDKNFGVITRFHRVEFDTRNKRKFEFTTKNQLVKEFQQCFEKSLSDPSLDMDRAGLQQKLLDSRARQHFAESVFKAYVAKLAHRHACEDFERAVSYAKNKT